MKTISKTAVVAFALSASAWLATAQDEGAPRPRDERIQRREGPNDSGIPGGPGTPDGPRAPGGFRGPGALGGPGQPGERGGAPGRIGQHMPPPPIIAVLDADHDGVIDGKEIANAAKALKQL